MKKLVIGVWAILPCLSFAQQERAFTIQGRIERPTATAKVYLSIPGPDAPIVDSAVVTQGRFEFKGSSDGPTAVFLYYDRDNKGWTQQGRRADLVRLYVEQGTTTVHVADSMKNATVRGTEIQAEYVRYQGSIKAYDEGIDRINAVYASATPDQRQDTSFANPLRKAYMEFANKKRAVQAGYLRDNPGSYFGLLALQDLLYAGDDILALEPAYLALEAQVRSTALGKNFAGQIAAAKATAIGALAPDFVQHDTNDRPVRLSDFKGQYVLLDFWASWCGPCRKENPNVVAAYRRFKDRNFTVLGVSLDQPGKKDSWLQAIEKDSLAWTNVSDLKFWNNAVAKLYGVRGIPQNYLIDPQGKIVASNLRGEALHNKLEELLD